MDIEYKRPKNDDDNVDKFTDDFMDYDNIIKSPSVSENGWHTINIPIYSKWIYMKNSYNDGSYGENNEKYYNNNLHSPNVYKMYIPVEFEDIGDVWDNIWPTLIQYGMCAKIVTEKLIDRLNSGKQKGKNIVIYLGVEENYNKKEWENFFKTLYELIPNHIKMMDLPKDTFGIKGTSFSMRRERGDDALYSYEHSNIPKESLFYDLIDFKNINNEINF